MNKYSKEHKELVRQLLEYFISASVHFFERAVKNGREFRKEPQK